MSKELKALEKIKNNDFHGQSFRNHEEDYCIIETALKDYEETDNQLYDLFEKFGISNRKDLLKKLKALEIIKENIGIKMSIDEDAGCLYVPTVKCFQPLEQNIVIVGYVKGKENIDLLKEVLL